MYNIDKICNNMLDDNDIYIENTHVNNMLTKFCMYVYLDDFYSVYKKSIMKTLCKVNL